MISNWIWLDAIRSCHDVADVSVFFDDNWTEALPAGGSVISRRELFAADLSVNSRGSVENLSAIHFFWPFFCSALS